MTAGNIPQLGAIIQVERNNRARGFRLFVWQILYTLALLAALAVFLGSSALLVWRMRWFVHPSDHLLPLILGGIASQLAEVFAGASLDCNRLVPPCGTTTGINAAGVFQEIRLRARALHLERLAVLQIRHNRGWVVVNLLELSQ